MDVGLAHADRCWQFWIDYLFRFAVAVRSFEMDMIDDEFM